MKLIQRKIKSGKTEAIEDVEEEQPEDEPKTINFMDVLKQSVAHATKKRRAPRRTAKRATSRKKAAPRKRRAKKKAS
jgi:non-homologous end joining protein Ku